MNRYVMAGLVALGLVACSAQGPVPVVIVEATTIPSTTVAVAVSPTFSSEPATEDAFLSLVRANTNLEWVFSDDELLALGWQFCGFLDQGLTADYIFETMAEATMDGGMDESTAMDLASLFGAAIGAFCPEYDWTLS